MIQNTTDITEQEIEKLLAGVVNEGKTLKELRGISDNVMESVYAYAYEHYNDGKLDEAERVFRFLCMYDMKNPDYFFGLGAVYQVKKEYEKACNLYSLAFLLDNTNFSPVFFSGQCRLSLNNVVEALRCFERVSVECKNNSALVKKASAYVKVLKRNRKDLEEEVNKTVNNK